MSNVVSVFEQAQHLENKTLAPTRGHHRQHVFTFNARFDGLLLAWLEFFEIEKSEPFVDCLFLRILKLLSWNIGLSLWLTGNSAVLA